MPRDRPQVTLAMSNQSLRQSTLDTLLLKALAGSHSRQSNADLRDKHRIATAVPANDDCQLRPLQTLLE
jgi:hypothetical protein